MALAAVVLSRFCPILSCHVDLSGKRANGAWAHLDERVGLITEECRHEKLIAAELERGVLHSESGTVR